jgi:predicted RNA-binding Zn ribbon-like protein
MEKDPVNATLPVTWKGKILSPILLLPLIAGNPCLDFLNTVESRPYPAKRHDTFHEYSDLLAFSLRINIITIDTYNELSMQASQAAKKAERSCSDARCFRDALYAIIDVLPEMPAASTQMIFETARRRARESESLEWQYGSMVLIEHPEDEGLDYPWLILVRAAERLLRSSKASRIRICAAEECGRTFLDTSKNGTRRWCSMNLCGNRSKALRFRTRSLEN